jgi:protein TonB
MEVKKSAKADLEGRWWQRFALGLVVALSGLMVALEYSIDPTEPLDDPELVELLDIDRELAPLMRQEHEVPLVPKAAPAPVQKLQIVEEEHAEEAEQERQPEKLVEGDLTEEQPEPQPVVEDNEEPVVSFRVVEDLPQPPGGYQEFIKWLSRNLRYPVAAQERKLQGEVVVAFIVNKDGSVTDVHIVKSLNSYCDREALRVLRTMTQWTPGVMDSKTCRTQVCIPIEFKL